MVVPKRGMLGKVPIREEEKMRGLIFAATAVATLAVAGSLVSTRADAMPIAIAGGLGASAHEPAEQVALVCQRRWNGYRWVRACYETGPNYYYDSAPGYYYGGGPSIYFGFSGRGYHRHHHHGHHFGHHGGHGHHHHGHH